MRTYDLDTPILNSNADGINSMPWTIRNAVEGVQIFGGIGSGKTSGSGRILALKYLSLGFGGLVLTVKPDERKLWEEYCKEANREDDLIIIKPSGDFRFNFLDFESRTTDGNISLTENIVEVLRTVIRAGESADTGKSDDAFWEGALNLLLSNTIDLLKMSKGKIDLQELYEVIQTVPKASQILPPSEADLSSAFWVNFIKVENEIKEIISERERTLTRIQGYEVELTLEEILEIPEARLYRSLDLFFLETFKNLSEKTRSIVDFTLTEFLHRLLKDPVYSLFCKGKSTVTPLDSLDGKIILVDLPVKKYHKVGRDAQILMKYVWQREMEKRDILTNDRPVFLWSDESQFFLHEHDSSFQSTARSSRVATVYLTQNLPNYHAMMGGDRSEYRVKSFLGTLGTKIFHANADIETNRYSSELIGDAFVEKETESSTMSGDSISKTINKTIELERTIRLEEFVAFRTGSKRNNYRVQGVLHKQGDPINSGKNYLKMSFDQNFKL